MGLGSLARPRALPARIAPRALARHGFHGRFSSVGRATALAIVRAYTLEIKKKLDETDREFLEYAIIDIRERFFSVSKEIIVPFDVTLSDGLQTTIPKADEKKQLLELSLRNAKHFRQDRFKQEKILDPERHTNPAHQGVDVNHWRNPRRERRMRVKKNGAPMKAVMMPRGISTVEASRAMVSTSRRKAAPIDIDAHMRPTTRNRESNIRCISCRPPVG